MSIKLVDTLESMGNFPVANADGIQFTDGESLQKKLDDGTLGSGNVGASYIELSQEEYDALSDEEKVNGSEYRTYDTGHIYKLGVEFGKETDISSKQDNLSQVKFTMRRNSVSEPRYCLIGSSDLSQNLLMCEPYRFQGIFGDGTTSVENKSIIDFMVSFREGVGNPDEVLSGFANSSKGFEFVDLLITADETTNMAYAYVDFKTSGSVATGEITKPVLEAESYMDFAESFELVDTYQGTLVCKMSDYCKVITEIKDEVSDSTVWSSKKTSEKIDALISDTSSTTSTYSSKKIDSKLAKYSKQYSASHSRYIKIGSVPISSGVVTKTTLIMSLFAMSGVTSEYPVGLLNINISSGSGGNAFNINGTTTISLNNTNNLNTPRIVVDKTSTHYNLYVDCVYAYMWIEYMILNQDSHYENGNFEALDALEGTEYWSSVTSDDIRYVGDMAKLDDSSSSTTSTYSSAKIDRKFAPRHFGTDNKTSYLKLQLGTMTTHEPITVTDQYGGQVKILGMYDLSTYKSVKVIRLSYGDWSTHSGTDFTNTSSGDANYKIRRFFYCPDDNNYYLEIRQYSYISVEGAPDATMVMNLPVEISAMTLIPESKYASINDSSTSETSTWSSSKIASTIDNKLLVGTAEPTTATLPVGCWYGVYEE